MKPGRQYRKGHYGTGRTRPATTPAKHLKPEEVSPEVASCLDFNSQSVVSRALRISRKCITCGKKLLLKVPNVRNGLQGAKCLSCVVKLRNAERYAELKKSGKWKGGRKIDWYGYILVYRPTHPREQNGYVFEHRLVMEKKLGRYLWSFETVHHRNANRQDNRIENLELWVGNHGYGARATEVKHCRTCTCALVSNA